jgi:hypothetical protein
MDWFIYELLTNAEPYYQFKEIIKEGYITNYKKDKKFETWMERPRKILESLLVASEYLSHLLGDESNK